jgi:hypothetical protein
LNDFLAIYLVDLKATEFLDVIEYLFATHAVEEFIIGLSR